MKKRHLILSILVVIGLLLTHAEPAVGLSLKGRAVTIENRDLPPAEESVRENRFFRYVVKRPPYEPASSGSAAPQTPPRQSQFLPKTRLIPLRFL